MQKRVMVLVFIVALFVVACSPQYNYPTGSAQYQGQYQQPPPQQQQYIGGGCGIAPAEGYGENTAIPKGNFAV